MHIMLPKRLYTHIAKLPRSHRSESPLTNKKKTENAIAMLSHQKLFPKPPPYNENTTATTTPTTTAPKLPFLAPAPLPSPLPLPLPPLNPSKSSFGCAVVTSVLPTALSTPFALSTLFIAGPTLKKSTSTKPGAFPYTSVQLSRREPREPTPVSAFVTFTYVLLGCWMPNTCVLYRK